MAWGGARPGSGPKQQRRAAGALPSVSEAAQERRASPPALLTPVAEAMPRKPLDIGHDVLARSLTRYSGAGGAVFFGGRAQAPQQAQGRQAFNPFKPNLALHPPRSVPERTEPELAMDQEIVIATEWAGVALASAVAEGVTFLGYPYLSEIAQRPEYRVIVETIATESTRKWIKFEAKGDQDKTERIKQLEDEFRRLRVQDWLRESSEHDGFFGRGHLYLDTGDTENRDELRLPIGDGWNDISKAKVSREKPLLRICTVEPVWCYPTNYNSNDPLRPDWYKPSAWFVQGKELHASRILTFVGREVPDLLKPAYSFGGLSLSQMAKPYVDNWLRTRQSVADLIHAFTVFALSTDLQSTLQNGGDQLFRRLALFSNLRDNRGVMALNKDTEELNNISAPLGTLDVLQAQTQEHMASVSRIPLVKLLGIQPAGLNASSEGEVRTFYDTIAAYQEKFYTQNLRRVMGFVMLSLWGEVDPDITFSFESLWSLNEKEEAEVRKIDAETGGLLMTGGVIDPKEERQRVASAADTPYHSLDVDDMPEPPPDDEGGDGDEPDEGDGNPGDGGATAEDAAIPFDLAMALDAEWREGDHPRGQPGNVGQFGPGGGGGEGKAPAGYSREMSGKSTAELQFLAGRAQEILGSPKSGVRAKAQARQIGTGAKKELEARRSAEPKKANASTLYTPTTMTADQVVASMPGAAEAIQAVRAKLAASVPTDAPVSKGGHKQEDGTYTPERQAVHAAVVNQIFTPENIKRALPAQGDKPVLTVLGGRGGSGKSWLSGKDGPVDASKSILLDSDHIKSMLPGYDGSMAALYHEEATHILDLMDRRATALGVNTIHDATMKSEGTTALRLAAYEGAGYEVEGYYMYLAPQEAAQRAMKRFSKGGTFTGRFVPPEVILGNTNNEKNFDAMSGGMRKWAVYDNSVPAGQPPRQVSRSW